MVTLGRGRRPRRTSRPQPARCGCDGRRRQVCRWPHGSMQRSTRNEARRWAGERVSGLRHKSILDRCLQRKAANSRLEQCSTNLNNAQCPCRYSGSHIPMGLASACRRGGRIATRPVVSCWQLCCLSRRVSTLGAFRERLRRSFRFGSIQKAENCTGQRERYVSVKDFLTY